MKQFIASLCLVLAATSVVFAQTKGKKDSAMRAEQELLKVNREYDDALRRGDISALELIFGEEFIYTTTSGEVVNKSQQLELIRSGQMKIESGASNDVQVRLYGNMALVIGSLRRRGNLKVRPSIQRSVILQCG